MPEAAVDKDARPVLRQHHIRTPRQLLYMNAEAEPLRMEIPAHRHLRPRVLGPDMRHAIVPLLRCHRVGHGGIVLDVVIISKYSGFCRQDNVLPWKSLHP